MHYVKTRIIELAVIALLALVALWPHIFQSQSVTIPSGITPFTHYKYHESWSDRDVALAAVVHCPDSLFDRSRFSGDKPIVSKIGTNAYAVSYQKGVWVSVEKPSGNLFDVIYFRSTPSGEWKIKSFQYTDPYLLSIARSIIHDVNGTVYAQVNITKVGDQKTVDLYCFPNPNK